MSLNILRWHGGFGGDMLLNLVLRSHPNIKTNVVFKPDLLANGAMELDYSHLSNGITQTKRIALESKYLKDVDPAQLQQELEILKSDSHVWWIKSHYHDHDICGDCIIDISVDAKMLPFVVSTNINKTQTLTNDASNQPSTYRRAVHDLAMHFIATSTINKTISVDQLLGSWEDLKSAMAVFDVELNDQFKNFHQSWVYCNQQYLPGAEYQACIADQQRSVDLSALSVIEQHCLLAVRNFKRI